MYTLFIIYLFTIWSGVICEGPIVQIKEGKLKGKILNTKNGRLFNAFMGIPYAEPPINELRFQAPQPFGPWKGIRNADVHNHTVCPQRDIYRRSMLIEGGEDCLYLNVYTPQLPHEGEESLPVMVFLHGGGFLCGGGNSMWYGPEILLDQRIVLVVPNYRLGALGFLSTGDEIVPGNNGLKDQNLVLRWIQNNIGQFGGNPDSVTLFGESAGGASVQLHTLSPLSRGLFKAIIAQSGSALCNWVHAPKGENINQAKKLAESFNCPTGSSQELVQCLKKVDAHEIVAKDRLYLEWDLDPMIPFKPVTEPFSEGAFISQSPREIIRSGNFADVPWIIGLNSEDGLLRAAAFLGIPHLFDELNEDTNSKLAISLIYGPNTDNPNAISEKIRKFYVGDGKFSNTSKSAIIDLYTDGWFLGCIDEAIMMNMKYGKSPIYYYLFSHESGASFSQIFGEPDGVHGVCHADDLQYLFPVADGLFPNKKITEGDRKVTKFLTTLWTNFAKFNNPTPNIEGTIKNKWTPVKTDNMEYFRIDAKGGIMEDGLMIERAKFWRTLPTHPEKLEINKDEL